MDALQKQFSDRHQKHPGADFHPSQCAMDVIWGVYLEENCRRRRITITLSAIKAL